MRKTRFLFVIVFLLLTVSGIYAQQDVSPRSNRAAQYFLGAENELLVPVNVWGFVLRPGQYMVPNNTDLISLLSYAGGPTESGKISSIKIVRSDPRAGNVVFNIDVKKYLETADIRLIPTLKPNDTVIVKGTTFYWISRFFEFISRLTVLAQIVYFIAIAQEYLSR